MYSEFVPNPAPSGASRGYALSAITNTVYDSYEAADERRAIILNGDYTVRTTGVVANTPYHFNEKYLDPVNGPLSYNNFSTNMPLIRYADVLLSYAEAVNEANNGPNTDAYAAINKVRTRANATEFSGMTKAEFFNGIVDERARELFSEGIRWFDLKRWGLLERVEQRPSAPNIADVDVQLPKHSVFPYPQTELDANPNLKQNEGY